MKRKKVKKANGKEMVVGRERRKAEGREKGRMERRMIMTMG